MMWHGYLMTVNLNLTGPQYAELSAAARVLGPASDPQPARLCHWVISGSATIFEALFDEATITVAAWTDRLGDILEVDPGDISTDTVTRHYSRVATSVVTYTEGGVEYLQVALFGDVGITWTALGDEARAYMAGHLFVAADDATANEKSRADSLCDGAADQVQILAALAAARSVELSSGTFDITEGFSIPAAKKLRGQAGWATVLYGDFLGFLLRTREGATVRDLKLSSAGADTHCHGMRADTGSTIERLWLDCQQNGIDMVEQSDITISDVRFTDIFSDVPEAPWAACIHIATGSHDITVDGIQIDRAGRGCEVENGSHDVILRNGVLTGVTLSDYYSFTIDCHTHLGWGSVDNVTYENFVLTRCAALTVQGVHEGERISNVTYRNITLIDPTLAGYNYAVWVTNADHVLLEDITVTGCPAGFECHEADSTDVTLINCSWV